VDEIEATPPFKLVWARHGVFLASWEDVYISRSLLSYGEYAKLEWDALDDLLPADANVGLLKVDVEGFEQRVLQGTKATIERCRPVIYLENDRLDRSQALIEWLWAAGYRMAWHVPPMFNPDNFAGQSQDLYPRVASFNMLAVPTESKIELPGHLLVNNAKHHPLRPASAG